MRYVARSDCSKTKNKAQIDRVVSCPLFALSRPELLHCTCPLMTQSGLELPKRSFYCNVPPIFLRKSRKGLYF